MNDDDDDEDISMSSNSSGIYFNIKSKTSNTIQDHDYEGYGRDAFLQDLYEYEKRHHTKIKLDYTEFHNLIGKLDDL